MPPTSPLASPATGRRDFLKQAGSTSLGLLFTTCSFVELARGGAQASAAPLTSPKRREVRIAGRRIKTVDIHAHCWVPEVRELVKDYPWSQSMRTQLDAPVLGEQVNVANVDQRLRAMDEGGIDVQAVSVNTFWDPAERDLASQIVKLQNEKIAELCAAHPDRFVGMASVTLAYPELAAQQFEDAVKKLGMRGCLIGGSVNGAELSAPQFNPFWAKAEELEAVVFIHPQNWGAAAQLASRLQGNGLLTNVIGYPLETTIALSHLIWEGTLDRYSGLKICAAHGGGYLASYIGRSGACFNQLSSPGACKPTKKHPSEYLKQLYYDSMVFTPEGLRHLIAETGASQIMLGTDFPFRWSSQTVDEVMNASGLSDAEREAILSGNAAKLFRIT